MTLYESPYNAYNPAPPYATKFTYISGTVYPSPAVYSDNTLDLHPGGRTGHTVIYFIK